jgi:hypothetical protein
VDKISGNCRGVLIGAKPPAHLLALDRAQRTRNIVLARPCPER